MRMNRNLLAQICLDIEKAGGSVRDYLQESGFLSPWGTWYRLQREELGRKPHQIKEGKGSENMAKKITLAQKKRAVEIALNGGNPLPYLKQCGSERPDGLWYTIKQDLKKADPTAYERLPKRCGEKKPEKPAEEEPDDDDPKYRDPEYLASCGTERKVTGNEPEKTEPVAEKAEAVVENKETVVKKTETVVENKAEAVEKPETAAEPEADPFIVTAVEGKFGEYHFDAENNFIGWKPMEGPIICMSAEKWHKFIDELLKAMKKLYGERASKNEHE